MNTINERQRTMSHPHFFLSTLLSVSPCLDHHRYDTVQYILFNAATLNYSPPLQFSWARWLHSEMVLRAKQESFSSQHKQRWGKGIGLSNMPKEKKRKFFQRSICGIKGQLWPLHEARDQRLATCKRIDFCIWAMWERYMNDGGMQL